MRAAWGYDQPDAADINSSMYKARLLSCPGLSHKEGPATFRKRQAYDSFLKKVEGAEERDTDTLCLIAMAKMRAVAVDKMLDMTDALEEAVGGYDKNVGTMDQQRFSATLGVLFTGSLSIEDIRLFCIKYGTDGPDPYAPDMPLKVKWKQFAIDFDNVVPPPDPVPAPKGAMMQHLMLLRAEAVRMRLDLSDAFEEYTGSLKERNSGAMAKNRFRATMGQLFIGKIDSQVLTEICDEYGIGDLDPREGGYMKVRWKKFADDFDLVPPMPPPTPPDPTRDIFGYMRGMNTYCNLHAIDLEDSLEEYMGGKNACFSDLMPSEKFLRGIGVLLGKASNSYPHDEAMLKRICHTYGTGPPHKRDPTVLESVQWREFAKDLRNIQPMPYLRSLTLNEEMYP